MMFKKMSIAFDVKTCKGNTASVSTNFYFLIDFLIDNSIYKLLYATRIKCLKALI